MRSGDRGYVIPITLMTILYLVFELAFNARLLDITGSLVSPDDVKAIERWGRIISGVAITLYIWGTQLMPRMWAQRSNVPNAICVLGISAVIIIVATYVFEDNLLKWIVGRCNAHERHIAVELGLIEDSILSEKLGIKGLDISRKVINSPEEKAFLALLPAMAILTPDIPGKLDQPIHALIERDVREHICSPAYQFKGPFQQSVAEVEKKFKEYQANQDRLKQATVQGDPEAMWHQYKDTLENQWPFVTPDRVPPILRRSVVQRVRASGILVPDNWDPADHQTFIKAAVNLVAAKRGRLPDSKVPPGLDEAAFLALPQVQNAWRERLLGHLGQPTGIMLSPTMSEAQFEASIYNTALSDYLRTRLEQMTRPDADFGPTGSQAKLGFDAMEALVAPPMALFFSLLGGVVHVYKTLRYLVTLKADSSKRSKVVRTFVLCFALLPLALPNAITRSHAFDDLSSGDGVSMTVTALFARWVIQAQPYSYPVCEWIRTQLLYGISFNTEGKKADAGPREQMCTAPVDVYQKGLGQ